MPHLGEDYWTQQNEDNKEDREVVDDDLDHNPETNSKSYLVLLVRAVAILKKLPEAVVVSGGCVCVCVCVCVCW